MFFPCTARPKGLPSDQPNSVLQDRSGRVWVGFHEGGLLLFSGGAYHLLTARDGLPDGEIFSIRETPGGDLLMGSRAGLVRMHGAQFSSYIPQDPLSRRVVFDGARRCRRARLDGHSGRPRRTPREGSTRS